MFPGPVWVYIGPIHFACVEETTMKVSDILQVKGNTLYTAQPDMPLASALKPWLNVTSARWW
jgi:hypothetical protein